MKTKDNAPKLGFPKYNRNEIVRFYHNGTAYEGKILVVNGLGIFGMTDQPYYDIVVEGDEPMLYKNIPESSIGKSAL